MAIGQVSSCEFDGELEMLVDRGLKDLPEEGGALGGRVRFFDI